MQEMRRAKLYERSCLQHHNQKAQKQTQSSSARSKAKDAPKSPQNFLLNLNIGKPPSLLILNQFTLSCSVRHSEKVFLPRFLTLSRRANPRLNPTL